MKKPYKPPRLEKYGRIASLTTGQSGPFSDGKSGMFQTMGGGMGMP